MLGLFGFRDQGGLLRFQQTPTLGRLARCDKKKKNPPISNTAVTWTRKKKRRWQDLGFRVITNISAEGLESPVKVHILIRSVTHPGHVTHFSVCGRTRKSNIKMSRPRSTSTDGQDRCLMWMYPHDLF